MISVASCSLSRAARWKGEREVSIAERGTGNVIDEEEEDGLLGTQRRWIYKAVFEGVFM